MKFERRALWAMPAVMVIAAVAALILWVRSDGDTPANQDATPTPTSTATPCPVDEAICEFARRVEYEFREGDPKTLLSPKSTYYPDTGVILAGTQAFRLAPLEPKVMSIGCPLDAPAAPCAEFFSLVLTASPSDQQSDRISRVLLGFQRDGNELPIVTTNILAGGIEVIAAGGDSIRCDLSGRGPSADCIGTRFYPWSSGPDIVRQPAPTPSPAASGTPGADPLAGLVASPLTPAAQSSIGYDATVYYSTGCFACGRPQIPNLYRAYRASSGNLRTDDLFGPLLAKAGGYPHDVAVDWEHGHLLVLVCATGYCGGEGEPSPDATLKVFRSRDGGVSFVEEAAPDIRPGAFVVDFAKDQVIVSFGEQKGVEFTFRHFLYPSNQPLTLPEGIASAEPVVDRQGSIVWRTYSPGIGAVDADGKIVVASSPGKELARLNAEPYGWRALWVERNGPVYHGLIDQSGVKGLFSHGDYLDVRGQLPTGLLYANVALAQPFGFGVDGGSAACKQQQPIYPALIDFNAHTVHPIIELGDECVDGRHKFINAILARPVLRVTTGGDCLNVRRDPSTGAGTLGCFVDGVLLTPRLEGVGAPVAGWLPVFTPALESGWVAEEFVSR